MDYVNLSNNLSNLSAEALDLTGRLPPLNQAQQFARCHAPWHLWLDKYSYPWPIRCDLAAEYWREQMHWAIQNGDRNGEREFRRKADAFPSGKTASLAMAVALANNGSLSEYPNRTLTWLDSLKRQHGARFGFVELVADSRLLLHLGRANVLENVGLYADRTTGLPLIPGTALKGVVSTWACWANHFNVADGSFREFHRESTQRRNFDAEEAKLARQILGDDSQTGSEHAGDVIFIGGFPLTPPALGLDIVNPHHESSGQEKTKLTPNAFLCVEPQPVTIWRFAYFVRTGTPDHGNILTQTERWIKEALTQLGIGAKTAAGYGRFRDPTIQNLVAPIPATNQIQPRTPRPNIPTYDEYCAKTPDWKRVVDGLADKKQWEQEYIVRFFSSEPGRTIAAAWGSGLNAMRLKADLRKAGWEDET